MKEVLNIYDLQKELNVGRNTALKIFKDPELKGYRDETNHGAWVVKRENLEDWQFRQFLKEQEEKFNKMNKGKEEIWQTRKSN